MSSFTSRRHRETPDPRLARRDSMDDSRLGVGVVNVASVSSAAINALAAGTAALCPTWWQKYPQIMAGVQQAVASYGQAAITAAIAQAYTGAGMGIIFPASDQLLAVIQTIPGYPFVDTNMANGVAAGVVTCAMSQPAGTGAGAAAQAPACSQWWQSYPQIMTGIQSAVTQYGQAAVAQAISMVYLGSDLSIPFPGNSALVQVIRSLPGFPFSDVAAAATLASSVVTCAVSQQGQQQQNPFQQQNQNPFQQGNQQYNPYQQQQQCPQGWSPAPVQCPSGYMVTTEPSSGCQACAPLPISATPTPTPVPVPVPVPVPAPGPAPSPILASVTGNTGILVGVLAAVAIGAAVVFGRKGSGGAASDEGSPPSPGGRRPGSSSPPSGSRFGGSRR